MKNVIVSILLVGLVLGSFNSSDVTENVKAQDTKKSEVALSSDLISTYFTGKQLEGYHFEQTFQKGYSEKDYPYVDYKIELDKIVSEDGKAIYKSKNGSVSIFTKYKDEVYFNEYWEIGYGGDYFLLFKAVNVKTKKVRRIYRAFDDIGAEDFYPKMIYKDRIYYEQRPADGDEGDDDSFTPIGYISVADLEGTHIEHIEIPNYTLKSGFLGIANDRMYYTSSNGKKLAGIESCDLYGENYQKVAEGFKIRRGSLDYDDEGWYFLGGKKAPYKDLCKLDFETGEAKIIRKKNSAKVKINVKAGDEFSVKGKYIYYVGKNRRVYRYNTKTKEVKLFLKKPAYYIYVSGKYLYYRLDPKKTSKQKSYCWYRVKLSGKKKVEIVYKFI